MAEWVSTPETFSVEEIPAYLPGGEGTHTYLWIEKRGLTTPEAVKRLGAALGVPDRDIGYAGMKDRHATTRQWLSVPGVDPAAALALSIPDLRVLQASRHGNKLRTGHLRGNKFEVVLTGVADDERGFLETALATLAKTGLPNKFGGQRFGAAGDNVKVGLAILRGERRERDHRRRKLLLSAVQSEVFNRALAKRAASGGLLVVRGGDVLQKVASGGLFVSEDVATDQARVDAGELVPTGPMPGSREIEPPPGSASAALEDEALAEVGVTREELASAGRDLPGARRPVVVSVGDPSVERLPSSLRLRFSLPPGSYATQLLQALAEGALAAAGPGLAKPVLTFPVPGSAA